MNLARREEPRDSHRAENSFDNAAILEDDFAVGVQIYGNHGERQLEGVEFRFAKVVFKQIGNPAHPKQGRAFGERPAIEPGLVEIRHNFFNLKGREASRIERAEDGPGARPGHSADAETFPLKDTQNPQMGSAPHPAAAEIQCNFSHKHLVGYNYTHDPPER